MANNSASDFDTGRRKGWARYLRKSLDCDVRWLDRTLLMPLTARTEVLYAAQAPKVFGDVYASGRNPDGNYWTEFDDSGKRFNLFERVCEHVPASREWLLNEFLPYMREDPPPIAHSRDYLTGYLKIRSLRILPGRAASALEHLRPRLYGRLTRRSTRALANAAMPSSLLFSMTFLHEWVWISRRQGAAHLEEVMHTIFLSFCKAFIVRGFDDASEVQRALEGPLYRAIVSIQHWGDRSPPSACPAMLMDLPKLPLLIADTEQVRDACACLHAAGEEWYERIGIPLPESYEAIPDSRWAPTDRSIKTAMATIVRGVLAAHKKITAEYQNSLLCVAPKIVPIVYQSESTRSRRRSNNDRRVSARR